MTQNSPAGRKVRFGHIHADDVDFLGALTAIEAAIDRAQGGYVVTPNVDHICLAETHQGLRASYAEATLSVADGMPLLWLARAMRCALPEKISGSDLIRPLMQRAAAKGTRVYFLGAAPGVAQKAADRLSKDCPGLIVAGVDSPPLGFDQNPALNQTALDKIRAANAQLLLVALGCPKQELWMHVNRAALAPAVSIGIGASLDFIAGTVRRAPRWMSSVGLEWLYRLAQEPKRMAERYLVRDRAIVGIAWRMLRLPRAQRVFFS